MALTNADATKSGDRTNTTTVHFNVGGTIYEVSRSLLEQFPDTMLARMVSDTWQQAKKQKLEVNSTENNTDSKVDNDGAIFIERNGERFQYCLDYMRAAGRVELPATISRDSFLQDLAYYGFEEIDASKITTESLTHNFPITVMNNLKSRAKTWNKEIEDLGAKHKGLKEELEKSRVFVLMQEVEMKRSCLNLASYCLRFVTRETKLKKFPSLFWMDETWYSSYTDNNIEELKNTWRKVAQAEKVTGPETRADLNLPPLERFDYAQEFFFCLKQIGLEYKECLNLNDEYWYFIEKNCGNIISIPAPRLRKFK